MSQDLEHAQSRLENIRTVAPILAALRTISLSSWQMALNRRSVLGRYSDYLFSLLPAILAEMDAGPSQRPSSRRGPGRKPRAVSTASSPRAVAVVVIGSERGLCGRYNAAVLEKALAHWEALAASGASVEGVALGKRVAQTLSRHHELHATLGLPVTALPPFSLALDLVRPWLQRYETFALDAVDVVYNAYRSAGLYTPAVLRLLPPDLPVWDAGDVDPASFVIETDPVQLYTRIIEQSVTLRLYDVLLEGAAAEHSARFQLMESAKQNVDRLMEELTLAIQSARRQTITREMQELAAGAGLIGEDLKNR